MRYVLALSLVPLAVTAVQAQQPTCILQAIEKKLAGPAGSDFIKKCAVDALTTCERVADQRRLEEPARSLFINNCVNANVGPR